MFHGILSSCPDYALRRTPAKLQFQTGVTITKYGLLAEVHDLTRPLVRIAVEALRLRRVQ